jgi:hypothetical protein
VATQPDLQGLWVGFQQFPGIFNEAWAVKRPVIFAMENPWCSNLGVGQIDGFQLSESRSIDKKRVQGFQWAGIQVSTVASPESSVMKTARIGAVLNLSRLASVSRSRSKRPQLVTTMEMSLCSEKIMVQPLEAAGRDDPGIRFGQLWDRWSSFRALLPASRHAVSSR